MYRCVCAIDTIGAVLRKPLVVAALAASVLLAGCSAHSNPSTQAAAASSKTPTATPTPTPTVHVMSIDEAGKFYLASVCQANKTASANNAALTAQDLASIKQTAAVARDAYRAEATAFTNPAVLWPPTISAADVKLITDADFNIISNYNAMASAGTLDSAIAISNSYVDNGAGAAAQRIRLVLNLPADTSAGC